MPDPEEDVTETTESLTERTAHKMAKLKQELFAVFLFVLGLISAIDPQALILIFGPDSRGWVLMVTGVVVYLLRRFTSEPPEKLWRGRK